MKRSLPMLRGRRPVLRHVKHPRPATRADCLTGGMNAERPCPYVGCVWNLALDVMPNGTLHFNAPVTFHDGDPIPEVHIEQMPDTCVLDVCEREGETLEGIGAYYGVTRERIRQIETTALRMRRDQFGAVEQGETIPAPLSRRQLSRRKVGTAGEQAVCAHDDCSNVFTRKWHTQRYCSELCAVKADQDRRKAYKRSVRV